MHNDIEQNPTVFPSIRVLHKNGQIVYTGISKGTEHLSYCPIFPVYRLGVLRVADENESHEPVQIPLFRYQEKPFDGLVKTEYNPEHTYINPEVVDLGYIFRNCCGMRDATWIGRMSATVGSLLTEIAKSQLTHMESRRTKRNFEGNKWQPVAIFEGSTARNGYTGNPVLSEIPFLAFKEAREKLACELSEKSKRVLDTTGPKDMDIVHFGGFDASELFTSITSGQNIQKDGDIQSCEIILPDGTSGGMQAKAILIKLPNITVLKIKMKPNPDDDEFSIDISPNPKSGKEMAMDYRRGVRQSIKRTSGNVKVVARVGKDGNVDIGFSENPFVLARQFADLDSSMYIRNLDYTSLDHAVLAVLGALRIEDTSNDSPRYSEQTIKKIKKALKNQFQSHRQQNKKFIDIPEYRRDEMVRECLVMLNICHGRFLDIYKTLGLSALFKNQKAISELEKIDSESFRNMFTSDAQFVNYLVDLFDIARLDRIQ